MTSDAVPAEAAAVAPKILCSVLGPCCIRELQPDLAWRRRLPAMRRRRAVSSVARRWPKC